MKLFYIYSIFVVLLRLGLQAQYNRAIPLSKDADKYPYITLSSSAQSAVEISLDKNFNVSKVGRDKSKLMKLYEIIAQMEQGNENVVGSGIQVGVPARGNFYIKKKVEENKYIVSRYVFSSGSLSSNPNSTQVYLMQTIGGTSYVEKDKLSNIEYVLTNDVFMSGTQTFRVLNQVNKYEKGKFLIKKRIDKNVYLVNKIFLYGSYSQSIDSSQTFLLRAMGDFNYVDNDKTDELSYLMEEEMFNSGGNSYRVINQVLQEDSIVPDYPWFTKKEFVERLKRGETWRVLLFDKTQCVKCYGKGRTVLEGSCGRCNSTGVNYVNLNVKW